MRSRDVWLAQEQAELRVAGEQARHGRRREATRMEAEAECRVLVAIVTYNSAETILDCLRSFSFLTGANGAREIVIVAYFQANYTFRRK